MVQVKGSNILSPLGDSTETNYLAVKEGKTGLALYPQWGDLPFDITASLFTKDQEAAFLLEGYTRFESMMITSIRKALGTTKVDVTSSRVVLILSTTKANVACASAETSLDDMPLPSDAAQRIAEAIGIITQPLVVCNACISGLSAMIVAKRLLEQGSYDTAIVCGADEQSQFIVSGFQAFHALSPSPCRPFDIERNGLNLGEAAATLILSAEDTTEAAWHLTHAAIRNDAYHISAPSKTGEGAYKAITTVMNEADDVSLAFVNAHGTATLFNDQMESVALQRARLQDVPVNAYKGNYGHTMGAAGVMETILSMCAADEGWVLPTKGYDTLGVSGHIRVTKETERTDVPRFLKMLSGFGGCNAALLVSKESHSMSQKALPIDVQKTHEVMLTPMQVIADGNILERATDEQSFLTQLYKRFVTDYPKFYKMDQLSRLGFIASEILLQAEGETRFTPCDHRAVILFNRSSSKVTDAHYLRSIADKEAFFPSPALFVYTLPNIVTGEIAIRNHYHGETALYILPAADTPLQDEVIRATFADSVTDSMITGWINYDAPDSYEAHLYIYKKVKPSSNQ